jgi:hypothetical protein
MLYEDSKGRVFLPEEVEALPFWRIEKMGIHLYEEDFDELTI